MKVIVTALIIGGIGFGINHFIGWLANPDVLGNLAGAAENGIFVILWLIGLVIESKHQHHKANSVSS